MSAARHANRADLATAPGRPAPRRYRRGDTIRRRTQMSAQARTHGTATVLDVRSDALLLVSLHDSPVTVLDGADWRSWKTADVVLVRPATTNPTDPPEETP